VTVRCHSDEVGSDGGSRHVDWGLVLLNSARHTLAPSPHSTETDQPSSTPSSPPFAFAVAREGNRWGIPGGERPTTHIVKPNLSPFADFDLNEHLCLRAANKLGLRAARSEVVEFEDERALVVERYDRVPGTNTRVHQEDMCQALGLHPFRKYQSDNQLA
jgi:HipA-like C-terminal domain